MKYTILNIITVVVLLGLLAGRYAGMQVSLWWVAVVLLVYVSVVVYGCMTITSGFFMPVRCNSGTNERIIALSFDDGPHPAYTTQILETLKKYNAPAAFFCIGRNITGNEALLQRICDEGHLAGNHSYSHHFWFDLFGAGKMLADIRQTDAEIKRVTGLTPKLFRPPYGVMNPNLKKAIKRGGYIPVGWSIRSLDTTAKDKETLLLRVTKDLKPGAIILLHDTMELTAQMLPELIGHINKKGFKIVRADELLKIKAYA